MLTFDFNEFERRARELDGAPDQVAFALSKALNEAAEKTREKLIRETWPRHVKVRNKGFLNAALTTRGERATKKNLRVTIYDKLGRGHLSQHAEGGIKKAKGRLAIPTKRIADQRGASGVPKRLRPSNLKRRVVKGNFIFVPEGRGKNARLRLAYSLKTQAKIKKDVPFYEDFKVTMANELRRAFGPAMAAAMRTRRPR